jgi:hypothetical protein
MRMYWIISALAAVALTTLAVAQGVDQNSGSKSSSL